MLGLASEPLLAQLPHFLNRPLISLGCWVFPPLCLLPGADRFAHLGRAARGRIDFAVDGFGAGGLANLKDRAIAGGKDHRDELVGA